MAKTLYHSFFVSQLNPGGVYFQDVTDNQGDDGGDDDEEDVDAELQALAEVVLTFVYCRLAVKTMAVYDYVRLALQEIGEDSAKAASCLGDSNHADQV